MPGGALHAAVRVAHGHHPAVFGAVDYDQRAGLRLRQAGEFERILIAAVGEIEHVVVHRAQRLVLRVGDYEADHGGSLLSSTGVSSNV